MERPASAPSSSSALLSYGAWGAHAKVARLHRDAFAAPHPARGSERRRRGRRADLDAEALLGAQAALSQSADPRVIQTTLLHLAVQQAGAYSSSDSSS